MTETQLISVTISNSDNKISEVHTILTKEYIFHSITKATSIFL